MEDFNYANCFVCGEKNPIGIKLDFKIEKNVEEKFSKAEFTLSEVFEGYPGIIHGGIVTSILDEAMAKIILSEGIKAVTLSIQVKFLKSMSPGTAYSVKGSVKSRKKKFIFTTAEISEAGNAVAQAEAVFFVKKDI